MQQNPNQQLMLFPADESLQNAVSQHEAAGTEARGAVFTRRDVVEFILDLVGYSSEEPLYEQKILEPSFGEGDFLVPLVTRLLEAYARRQNDGQAALDTLGDCVRAVELNERTFRTTRTRLQTMMSLSGLPQDEVSALLDRWLVAGDFLLENLASSFHYVVGNPPYVRQEQIPNTLIAEYRRRFTTLFDRADLYVPFMEKSLSLLAPGGLLGFICADRWVKNRYGGPLRKLIAEYFHLKYFVDMTGRPAFRSEVAAYPAVTVIANDKPGPTRLPHKTHGKTLSLQELGAALRASGQTGSVMEVHGVVSGSDPWILDSPDHLKLVRRLEAAFPTIEQTGCKVGIGVATGADTVFIAPYADLDVEADRKLRLARTQDIANGTLHWQGYGILNPFDDQGHLVDLAAYPRLACYVHRHEQILRDRHVARQNPAAWYRTIDRIQPGIAIRPKLLVPDIQRTAQVVYEEGHLYPHHNLYYITSTTWDLHALRAVLMSGIAQLFVSVYSTPMRGGYLRYQAQYLRRIRLPRWQDIPDTVRHDLTSAARNHDDVTCSEIAFQLYQLSEDEQDTLWTYGEYEA